MSAHISLKNSLLMLLGGLVCAVGIAFLVNSFLDGPRLGRHYDFLSNYKSSVVSREILIINTEDFIESSDIFIVLMTLTEMDASNLILTGRISPSSSPITLSESDIRRRFIDEYILLGSNIRNLFEGIRMGSVTPVQAPLFVEQVVELAEQGRDRLITTLVDRDEDLLRAVAVFGNYLQVDTRPRLDSDGRLRRVKAFDNETSEEHPVYGYLKNRYAVSQIEHTGRRQILWLRSYDPQPEMLQLPYQQQTTPGSAFAARDIDIYLDSGGSIITTGNSVLRNIDIEVFREYKDAENILFNFLMQANELRVFSHITPDLIPLFHGEYANIFLDELLKSPNNENRSAWIASRINYISSLENYFNGNSGENLIGLYEEQIADTDPSDREQLDYLIAGKTELAVLLADMREAYNNFSFLYAKLKNDLEMSLCFMGPWPNSEYSALLANVLITGSFINPADKVLTFLWSIAAAFIVLLIIFLMRPVILLPAGFALSILPAIVFSGLFIYFSYWIDPLIALCSSLTGTITVFLLKCAYLDYRSRSFKMAYRTSVSKEVLRNLIREGRPRLSETSICFAAVIAVKDIYLMSREDREKPHDILKVRRSFYATAKKIINNAGAVIVGFEGDTILACFGSPIDKSYHPVTKAYNLVQNLIKNEKITWCFGIDAGECCFSWSPETGFSISGRPSVRSKILASKTARLKERALVTNSVLEKIHREGKKMGTFYDEASSYFSLPK